MAARRHCQCEKTRKHTQHDRKIVHTATKINDSSHHGHLQFSVLPAIFKLPAKSNSHSLPKSWLFPMENQPISWVINYYSEGVKRGQDATSTADTIVAAWEGIDSVLRRIIGRGGFNAIFFQSIEVTGQSYLWLATLSQDGQSVMDLQALRVLLLNQDTIDFAAGSDALLSSFLNRLVNLIGFSLTKRLLGPVLDPLITVEL